MVLGCYSDLVMMLAQPFDSDAMYKQVSSPTHVPAKTKQRSWKRGDLVTLDFEIQAIFWIFHHVQALYYPLVMANVSTA